MSCFSNVFKLKLSKFLGKIGTVLEILFHKLLDSNNSSKDAKKKISRQLLFVDFSKIFVTYQYLELLKCVQMIE